MIIKSFELYKFQIPLKFPLKIADEELTFREGLILKISDENSNHGFGEISPLPGFHKETLTQVTEQIKKYFSIILKAEFPQDIDLINNGIYSWFKDLDLYPTVQFGFEAALISLFAEQNQISTIEYLGGFINKHIEINALLSGSSKQIIEKTGQYLSDGFTVFKLKVGRNKIEEDVELVNEIDNLIKGKAKLRLDANQAWSLEDSIQFFQNIKIDNLEYIEEPIKNLKKLPQLLNVLNIPIALDENVLNISKISKNHLSQIRAIVIKPTVIGGIEKSLKLIRFAEDNGIAPVISDTFQSGVGLSILISIASKIVDKMPIISLIVQDFSIII